MPEFEVLDKSQSLNHADVSVNFEAHICNWSSGIQVTDHVLGDDVQPWCLFVNQTQESSDFVVKLTGFKLQFCMICRKFVRNLVIKSNSLTKARKRTALTLYKIAKLTYLTSKVKLSILGFIFT